MGAGNCGKMISRSLHILLCLLLLSQYCIWCKTLKCRENQLNSNQSCTINNYNSNDKPEFQFNSIHVTQVTFINSRMSVISRDIFSKLQNLERVDFSNCSIVKISRSNFAGAFNLLLLNLSYNNLTELNDLSFEGALNLNFIDLSYNRIHEIQPNAFKKLNKLSTINLCHNRIKILSNAIFVHTPLIKNIDLSANIIESIGSVDLLRNLSLTELNLNNNNMSAINETIFKNVNFIKHLYLNSNNFVIISFVNLKNIERISLNNNKLRALEISNFVQVLHANHNKLNNENLRINSDSSLQELSLVNNSLVGLYFVNSLKNLLVLDLSDNPMDSVYNQSDVFGKWSKLKILKLRSINLNQNDFRILSELHKLEVLDISYNHLKSIDFNSFSLSTSLQQLYINGNQLRNQTLDEVEYLFPQLNSINISDNAWLCNNLREVLTRLKQSKIEIMCDVNQSVTNELNIQGISCTKNNVTEMQMVHPIKDFVLDEQTNTNSNFEMDLTKTLTEFRKESELLKNKLNEILYELNDTAQVVQPSQHKDIMPVNHYDDSQTAIITKIDSSFVKLYDIKVYVLAVVQILANLFIICVVIYVFRRCRRRNKDRYNNYNFPTIMCSKPQKVQTSEQV